MLQTVGSESSSKVARLRCRVPMHHIAHASISPGIRTASRTLPSGSSGSPQCSRCHRLLLAFEYFQHFPLLPSFIHGDEKQADRSSIMNVVPAALRMIYLVAIPVRDPRLSVIMRRLATLNLCFHTCLQRCRVNFHGTTVPWYVWIGVLDVTASSIGGA
jgi:hypothetical protein